MAITIIGIDPGSVSAAYAVVRYPGWHVAKLDDVPVIDGMVSPSLLAMHLRSFAASSDLTASTAVIEKVSAMPKQGVSSTFKFGKGCGLIEGVVATLGFVTVQAAPTQWKRHFNLDSDAEKSRALALRRFPSAVEFLGRKKDHNRAEALLLALWYIETRLEP